ncbi:hypothetical protein E2C01_036343 [Portunus trituberculatus]|uniref:Uncharacterized protein n=1 Tax=Portunus trituberculatus TaxID=210409 RepID=A0A5B7FBN5_PORTR|nr:hypothetical protein [Portunus trituberculatus]
MPCCHIISEVFFRRVTATLPANYGFHNDTAHNRKNNINDNNNNNNNNSNSMGHLTQVFGHAAPPVRLNHYLSTPDSNTLHPYQ